MTSARIIVAVALVLGVSACTEHATPALPSVRPNPNPSPSQTRAQGREGSLQPDDPNDPLLIGYCSAQDRIVTLEGRLLSEHLSLEATLADMREAQRNALAAMEMFRRAGEPKLARLTSRWAESFEDVRAALIRGERPFDALKPAIAALGDIEKVFTCELDG
jgi:hypothetical protein